MSTEKSRHGTLLFSLAIGGAAVAFVILVYIPTQRKIRAVNDDIRVKHEFIVQTNNLRPTILDLERQMEEVERYAQQWQQQTPAPEQLANLFGQMTQQARESGATTIQFQPDKETPLAMLRRVGVNMTVRGTFPQVCQLIAALEQMHQPFWVDEVEIERGKDGKDMQAGLKMEVFASNPVKSD